MKHPQLNFRQPAVDRFIEVMTTAHILLDGNIRGEILKNINDYKDFVARLENKVYEKIKGKEKHSAFTFLNKKAPVYEADFCVSFNMAYFKDNMFNESFAEQIDMIAERIAKAGRKRYPGKKNKETLPLSERAKEVIKSSTETDFKTIKDVTDCLTLGTAIALLDGSLIIQREHIIEAVQYKNIGIYKDGLVRAAT